MAWITITIYGADTGVSGETPDKTTVEGISGVVSATIGVKAVHGRPTTDVQEYTYTDKSKRTLTKIRYTFEPETTFTAFPSSATDIEEYYHMDVLSKKYLWVDLSNYKLSHVGYSTGKVLAVNFVGIEVAENDEKGGKTIKYTFESRD